MTLSTLELKLVLDVIETDVIETDVIETDVIETSSSTSAIVKIGFG